jgi:predicted porin
VTSAFFGDVSPKLLYVSPKKYGLQLGASYAPKVDDSSAANPYKDLLQTGLAYQSDFGQNFFRVGGSYSQAAIDHDVAGADFSPLRSLHSLSLGSELNFGEVWDFGISASANSHDSGNADGAPNYGAHGVTASINYNNGKWVVGGYVQRAKSGESLAGRDDLSVFQLGVAYRIDPKVRIFAAFYDYRLKNNGSVSPDSPLATGNVLLTGIRWTL